MSSSSGTTASSERPIRRAALLTSARAWRGSGVSLAAVAEGLARAGWQVRLYAGTPAVAGEFAARGLDAEAVAADRTGLGELAGLRRRLNGFRPELLIADRPRDLRLATLAGLGRGTAVVYRFNLSVVRPGRDLLTRFALRRARQVVFLSETSRRGALARYPALARVPHRVVANGIDLDRFRPDPAAARAARERLGIAGPLVASVGALTPEKRHDLLLAAHARGGSGTPLVLLGEGPRREPLERLARELGLDVRFPGRLAPDELAGVLAAATVVVHACDVETFGLGVLEAMAAARPVLAVRGGAVPEVLGDAGVLVPPGHAEALGGALAALLADPARREALGAAARARAESEYSVERMQAGYVGLASELVGEGACA